ncbi:uncharacterized protein LOC110056012 isoform X2 [Orbicella faveolata]|nr:uncharacterized protein LOC110056012 isoform X2 [Orbicella faveolata]
MPPVPGNAGVPPRLPLPRDGFSTRQYLTSLAQSGTLETDNDSTVSPRTDTSQGAWTPTSSLPTGHSNVNPVIQLTIEDDFVACSADTIIRKNCDTTTYVCCCELTKY